MGWSCSAIASETLDKLTSAYLKQTKTQNVFKIKSNTYMFETSRREYEDGSVTGSIHKFITFSDEKGTNYARKVGSFKIDGRTGKIARGSLLKRLLRM